MEYIKIPREWIERLIELNKNCKGVEMEKIREENTLILHGYIESAEHLLIK